MISNPSIGQLTLHSLQQLYPIFSRMGQNRKVYSGVKKRAACVVVAIEVGFGESPSTQPFPPLGRGSYVTKFFYQTSTFACLWRYFQKVLVVLVGIGVTHQALTVHIAKGEFLNNRVGDFCKLHSTEKIVVVACRFGLVSG